MHEPPLLINTYLTESDQSEQKGSKNLLIGIQGHYRDRRTHHIRTVRTSR